MAKFFPNGGTKMERVNGRSTLWTAGLLAVLLAFGLVLAGCDDGSGNTDDGDAKKAAVTITIKNNATSGVLAAAITGVSVEDSLLAQDDKYLVGGWQNPDTSKAVAAGTTGTPFTVNVTVSHYNNDRYGFHVYAHYTFFDGRDSSYAAYTASEDQNVSSLTLVFDGSNLVKE
jgi:hypothetical protein